MIVRDRVNIISACLLLALVLVYGACARSYRPLMPPDSPGTPSYAGAPTVRWVFENLTKDGEPYTRAFIVIADKTVSIHTIGTFYGGVAMTMISGEEGAGNFPGEAISGFVVHIAGDGHEVYAGYDRDRDLLFIKSRRTGEGSAAEPYSTIKTIAMKGRGTPVPVK